MSVFAEFNSSHCWFCTLEKVALNWVLQDVTILRMLLLDVLVSANYQK